MKWKNFVVCGLFVVSGLYMYATQACSGSTDRIILERTSGEHVGSDDMVVEADFDGNGKLDRVFFAWSEAHVGEGFSLCVSMNGGNQEIKLLDFEGEPKNQGIRVSPPGKYVAGCVRGYNKGCSPSQITEVDLNLESIKFFMYESASRLYFWRDNQFQILYLTD